MGPMQDRYDLSGRKNNKLLKLKGVKFGFPIRRYSVSLSQIPNYAQGSFTRFWRGTYPDRSRP